MKTIILGLALLASMSSFAGEACILTAVGDSQLAVFSNGKRISQAWSMEAYAFKALDTLIEKGVCEAPTAQACILTAVGDSQLAVFLNGKRISKAWHTEAYAFEALDTLIEKGVCF